MTEAETPNFQNEVTVNETKLFMMDESLGELVNDSGMQIDIPNELDSVCDEFK